MVVGEIRTEGLGDWKIQIENRTVGIDGGDVEKSQSEEEMKELWGEGWKRGTEMLLHAN